MPQPPTQPDEDDVAAIVEEIASVIRAHQPHFAARKLYLRFVARGRTAHQVAELADGCGRTRGTLPLFRPGTGGDDRPPAA